MRLPRVRLTIRRLMVAVAIVAAILGAVLARMRWERDRLLDLLQRASAIQAEAQARAVTEFLRLRESAPDDPPEPE